ncbi:MAG TPA: hypothetical protein VIG06_12180 [Kofleriaceae bacterium]
MNPTCRAIATCAFVILASAGAAAADPTAIRKVGVGLRAGGAAAPEGHVLFDWALDGTWRPLPFVGIGGELSGGRVSLVEGDRVAVSFAPHVEVTHFARPSLELFGRAGMPLQTRSGGGVARAGGLAAYVAGGARWWPECYESGPELADQIGCVSFGLEVRALHAADGGYLVMPAVLPDGATVLMTSFTMGIEL